MAGQPIPPNVPPLEKGFNKALWRETNERIIPVSKQIDVFS